MIRRTARLLLLLTFVLPAAFDANAADEPSGKRSANKSVRIADIRVGLGGGYKVGLFTPVEVTLTGRPTSGEVTLTVRDGDGVPSIVPIPLDGRSNTVRGYVRFGRLDGDLTVTLTADGKRLDRKVFVPDATAEQSRFLRTLNSTWRIIVSTGRHPLDVEGTLDIVDATTTTGRDQTSATALTHIDDLRDLPEQWYGYEAADLVLLPTAAYAEDPSQTLTDAQAAALLRWVEMGGRLVFCVGRRARTVLADDSPLKRLAPGDLQEIVSLTRADALETYLGGGQSIRFDPGDDQTHAIEVARLSNPRGTVELAEDDLPLVIRTRHGFGSIVFLATDPDRPPLSGWTELPRFINELADLPARQRKVLDPHLEPRRFGYDDMAGQLRSSLDRFRGVRMVPFWLLGLLLALYVVLIGPADYFLLRRLGSRMRWTWVTFPTIVVLCCVGAYTMNVWAKQRTLRTSQIDLIDVDAETGSVRGTSWISLFSPSPRKLDLSVQPGSPDGSIPDESHTLVSWLGLPGDGLGGMSSRTLDLVPWTDRYKFSPQLDALLGVPIQVGFSKSLTARWSARTTVDLKSSLHLQGGLLFGSIENTLGTTLDDCLLVHGGQAYRLKKLRPGDRITDDDLSHPVQLQSHLMRRRSVQREDRSYREQAAPYRRDSIDPAYVLSMMMFFEAAGGHGYTALSNDYQNFVDLSRLADSDSAIFIARAEPQRHGADWLDDGKPLASPTDRHTTFYRFLLPVEREPLSP